MPGRLVMAIQKLVQKAAVAIANKPNDNSVAKGTKIPRPAADYSNNTHNGKSAYMATTKPTITAAPVSSCPFRRGRGLEVVCFFNNIGESKRNNGFRSAFKCIVVLGTLYFDGFLIFFFSNHSIDDNHGILDYNLDIGLL
jgi:hypothetical protein